MCLPGPPGPPGARGQKGARGRRGEKGRTGKKGDKGVMGHPGKSGKQGIMGPMGMKGAPGIKGEKGSIGPQGTPGAKGEPGESLSAPTVVVSPVKQSVNEKRTASFRCSASGHPDPSIVWTKADNRSEFAQSASSGAVLRLENVTENDSGLYQCSAVNILGQAQSLARLEVNGKFYKLIIVLSRNEKNRYFINFNSYIEPPSVTITCNDQNGKKLSGPDMLSRNLIMDA